MSNDAKTWKEARNKIMIVKDEKLDQMYFSFKEELSLRIRTDKQFRDQLFSPHNLENDICNANMRIPFSELGYSPDIARSLVLYIKGLMRDGYRISIDEYRVNFAHTEENCIVVELTLWESLQDI